MQSRASRARLQSAFQHFAFRELTDYPARIRTLTSRTKTCCATVTPRGSGESRGEGDTGGRGADGSAPATPGGSVTVRGRFPAGPSRFKPRKANHPTRLVYPSGHAPDLSTTAHQAGKPNILRSSKRLSNQRLCKRSQDTRISPLWPGSWGPVGQSADRRQMKHAPRQHRGR